MRSSGCSWQKGSLPEDQAVSGLALCLTKFCSFHEEARALLSPAWQPQADLSNVPQQLLEVAPAVQDMYLLPLQALKIQYFTYQQLGLLKSSSRADLVALQREG